MSQTGCAAHRWRRQSSAGVSCSRVERAASFATTAASMQPGVQRHSSRSGDGQHVAAGMWCNPLVTRSSGERYATSAVLRQVTGQHRALRRQFVGGGRGAPPYPRRTWLCRVDGDRRPCLRLAFGFCPSCKFDSMFNARGRHSYAHALAAELSSMSAIVHQGVVSGELVQSLILIRAFVHDNGRLATDGSHNVRCSVGTRLRSGSACVLQQHHTVRPEGDGQRPWWHCAAASSVSTKGHHA